MRSRRLAPAPAFALTLAAFLVAAPGAPASALDWTPPARVTQEQGSGLSALHELTASDSALHLVHGRSGPGARDDRLVYQRSLDGGVRWSEERALFRSTTDYRIVVPNLAVAAAGDQVVVAWRTRGPDGTALWIRRSEDGGIQWRPLQLLAASIRTRGLGVPALAASGPVVVLAWTDRESGDILVRRSEDGGASWAEPQALGRTRLTIECGAEVLDGLVGLAASGPMIHLAWSDGRPGECLADRLSVRTSPDSGRTWRATRRASRTRTYGWPEMAARGRVLLLGLQRPDGGLVVVRSRDWGQSFQEHAFEPLLDRGLGAADLVLPGDGQAWMVYPDVAYDGDKMLGSRVRFRSSPDRGRTWSAGELVLKSTPKLRQAANLVASDRRPVVVVQTGAADGSTSDIVAVLGG